MHYFIVFAVFLVWSGCRMDSPVDAQVLVHDEADNNRFKLDTVTIETAADLWTGRGERFDIRGNLKLNLLDLLFSPSIGEIQTADDMIESARTDEGGNVKPRLTYDPLYGQVVADDFDSLNYLTTFYNFEKAWSYFENVVGDSSGGTDDFGLIGFHGTIVVHSALPIPFPGVPAADNALFYTLSDTWLTLPVHDQGGIPFSMNDAVIAHEFQHRIFFKNVVDGPAFTYWFNQFRELAADENNPGPPSESNEQTTVTDVSLSMILFRGVDEGLADVFALGLHGNPRFMDMSLQDAPLSVPKFSAVSEQRDIEGDFASEMTFEVLLDPGVDACGGSIYQSQFNHYCLGTVLARTVWDATDRNPTVLQDAFLPAINSALSNTGERIAAASEDSGEFTFDLGFLLEPIAQELRSSGYAEDFCREVQIRFGSIVDGGGVPSCE